MKKIMIALAAVALAVSAQAATTKWGTSNAVTFNGTKLGGLTVELYVVGVNGSADALYDSRTTLNTPPVNKGKLNSGAGSMQDSYDYTSTVAGGALWDAASGDLGREYYMVIKYNDGTKDYTYTSSAVASSGLSDTAMGSLSFTFSDSVTDVAGTKNAWVSSVPEPTSAMLMLVGLAGLALRRRRA